MKITIEELEAYLSKLYNGRVTDQSLFMKLVEEVGEVAEVLNKRDGRKASDNENLNSRLANELVDVIHYALAIAALNRINLIDVILQKDKMASVKYHHERNLEQFLSERYRECRQKSTARTSWPLLLNSFTRLVPINPLPPVTKIF